MMMTSHGALPDRRKTMETCAHPLLGQRATVGQC